MDDHRFLKESGFTIPFQFIVLSFSNTPFDESLTTFHTCLYWSGCNIFFQSNPLGFAAAVSTVGVSIDTLSNFIFFTASTTVCVKFLIPPKRFSLGIPFKIENKDFPAVLDLSNIEVESSIIPLYLSKGFKTSFQDMYILPRTTPMF